MIKEVNFNLQGNKVLIDKNIPKKGVYLLVNPLRNKIYVGESSYIRRRLMQHIRTEYCNRLVCNKHLVNSIRKYGINNFRIFIVAEVSDDNERLKLESKLITTFRDCIGYDKVYNLRENSKSNVGLNCGDLHPFSVKEFIKKKIIKDYNTKKYLIIDLASKYGLSVQTISKVVGGSNKSVLINRILGEKNNSAKLKSNEVVNILEEFFVNGTKIITLSNLYGVSRACIQNIIHNKTYKNIKISEKLQKLMESYKIFDSSEKKSHNSSGVNNPNSKIKKEDVILIKEKYLNSINKSINNLTKELCQLNNMCFSTGTITKVIKGERDYLI